MSDQQILQRINCNHEFNQFTFFLFFCLMRAIFDQSSIISGIASNNIVKHFNWQLFLVNQNNTALTLRKHLILNSSFFQKVPIGSSPMRLTQWHHFGFSTIFQSDGNRKFNCFLINYILGSAQKLAQRQDVIDIIECILYSLAEHPVERLVFVKLLTPLQENVKLMIIERHTYHRLVFTLAQNTFEVQKRLRKFLTCYHNFQHL